MLNNSIGTRPSTIKTSSSLARMLMVSGQWSVVSGQWSAKSVFLLTTDHRPLTTVVFSHTFAAELCKQRREVRDHFVVRRTVGGDETVAVLHVLCVVAIGHTPEVCQPPARLVQDRFGRARVPLLRAWREMYVKITLALDNETDLDPDRAARHLLFEAERAHNRVHLRTAMIATHSEPQMRQLYLLRDAQTLRARLAAHDPRAMPARRIIEHIRVGQIDDAERGRALDSKTDLHGEIAVARDEPLRAVERIDDPHARAIKTAHSINRLF